LLPNPHLGIMVSIIRSLHLELHNVTSFSIHVIKVVVVVQTDVLD
jgi:hypothetical protein